jgi:ethylmalonyl-CoA/methylmalonyl-CoA decarboxylase
MVQKHGDFLNLVRDHGIGQITLEYKGNVAELTLDNPTKKNCLSGRMLYQFAHVVDNLVKQKDVHCLVMRGSPQSDIFCAGLDLNLAQEIVNTSQMGGMMSHMMTDTLSTLRKSGIISVALITGGAIGGGAELSTATDFRLMTSNAYCQFVHSKFGVAPAFGALNRLHSIVGRAHTIHLMCTSAKMTPQKALHMGYIETIVPDGTDPLAFSHEFLNPYSSHPCPEAMSQLKETIAHCELTVPEEARLHELMALRARWGSSSQKLPVLRSTDPQKIK